MFSFQELPHAGPKEVDLLGVEVALENRVPHALMEVLQRMRQAGTPSVARYFVHYDRGRGKTDSRMLSSLLKRSRQLLRLRSEYLAKTASLRPRRPIVATPPSQARKQSEATESQLAPALGLSRQVAVPCGQDSECSSDRSLSRQAAIPTSAAALQRRSRVSLRQGDRVLAESRSPTPREPQLDATSNSLTAATGSTH